MTRFTGICLTFVVMACSSYVPLAHAQVTAGPCTVGITGTTSMTYLTSTTGTTCTSTGAAVALSDITSPIVEGHTSTWSNGESRKFGHPQTLADGTQVFPRLDQGGAGSNGTVFVPVIHYWSFDANGLKQHRSEAANSSIVR